MPVQSQKRPFNLKITHQYQWKTGIGAQQRDINDTGVISHAEPITLRRVLLIMKRSHEGNAPDQDTEGRHIGYPAESMTEPVKWYHADEPSCEHHCENLGENLGR